MIKAVKKYRYLFLLLILSITTSLTVHAKDYYWISGAGNWNDGAHWSLSSGGSPSGLIPGKFDNVYFDNNSFSNPFSIINVPSDVHINNFEIKTDQSVSFYGGDIFFNIYGNISLKSTCIFDFSGGIRLKNEKNGANTIYTGGLDFYSDVHFDVGAWELKGHLKTGSSNTLFFNSGSLKSNGHTVHAKNIITNEKKYVFDFTNSNVSVLSRFNMSKGVNKGGSATFHIRGLEALPKEYSDFVRPIDYTRDATMFCASVPFKLELTITSDYNGRDISCFDSCDGEITVVASGTPGPYSYRYGPAPAPFGPSNVFSGLCVGSHSITVTDSSKQLIPGLYDICTVSDNINEPPVLSFDPPITINPSCNDVCDGKAFSFPTGGTGPLSIFWINSGETTPNPVLLCTGENPVIITDVNGCKIEVIVHISEPLAIIAAPTITPPTCNGDCDAAILLKPSGGNGAPYTFNWTPTPGSGAGTNPGTGFCSGIVNLTITDVNGCSADTIITILDYDVLTVTLSDIKNASCNGVCDGKATANPTGGLAPYTYEWFNNITGITTGITTQIMTSFCKGSYYVRITDALGCTIDSPILTITEPAPFVLKTDAYPVSCFGVCDGSVDIDVIGGTAPYTYSWTTVPGGIGIGASDSLSGLCPGQYQIIVTDANGCISTPVILEVLEPDAINITLSSINPSCYDECDGSAKAVVTGGVLSYVFNWSPAVGAGAGTATPSSMCANTYKLTVTDDNGCIAEESITLTSPPKYDISAIVTDLDCFGDTKGAIDLTVNSGGSGIGYTYTWSPTPPIGDGTPNIGGLTAGIWTVTIADSQLCDTTLSFVIMTPTKLTPTASVISPVLCFGECNGSAQVVITGGTAPYTISWNDPLNQTTLVANGLCKGTYIVTITDAKGCTGTASITITEPAPFILTTSQTDLACFGDCEATATVNVISGGVAPYTVLWNDPLNQTTFTAIDLCQGTYNAVVTDNNGCDTTLIITISEPDELTVAIGIIDGACFGTCTGTAFVTLTGGTPTFTYEWYDALTDTPLGVNNDSIFILCPGDYYCIITDDNGCETQSAIVTISELPEINTSIDAITDATCAVCDGTADVSASGGSGVFTFDWDPAPLTGDGTGSVTGLCSGSYNVTITDIAGCKETLIVTINDIALEVLILDAIDVTCFGACDGEATASYISIDPPYILEWFNNITGVSTGKFGSPVTGLCAGEYRAVLTNISGCTTSETIIITQPLEITGTITSTNIKCNGDCNGTATVTAKGGTGVLTYDWGIPLPGSGEGTPSASGLCAGPWEVLVTDELGCSKVFKTTVTQPIVLVITAESSTPITCFGKTDGSASVIVSGGTAPYTYNWIDCLTGLPIGQTTPLATGLSPGSYQCIVTDVNGCKITSTCLPVNNASEIKTIINTTNVSCFGECDGLISVIPSGGVPPYFYQWLDELGNPLLGQTNDTLDNVCTGTFNLEVTDLKGCSQTFGPIDMTSPNSAWEVLTSATNISCAGDCDGTASVVVLDGNNPPYTYAWDDPLLQVTPTASFLCVGTWTVTISDAGTCDTTITFNIIDEDPIFANLTKQQNVLCFGECTGEISVNPKGGVAPYTLIWSDGQVGTTATNLCAGPITLTITDGNGCTKDTIFVITEGTELTALSSFANNTTCGLCNGSATINVSGGKLPYSYDWTPDPLVGDGTKSALGLCPGIISVLVTDANGCELTQVFAISDINAEDVTTTSTDASCFGVCDGEAEATYICSDPPCTQEWFNALTGITTGVTTSKITDLCAGEYFVIVTNGSLCVTIEKVIIGSPTEIIDHSIINNITCNGGADGSIQLFPTGGSGSGYTYSWSPVPPNGDGTNEALTIGAGLWEVTVTDDDGCTQLFSYNVKSPAPIIITATPTNPTCNGFCNGFINLSVSGGGGSFTFEWYDSGVLIPGETSALLGGRCSGNYNVKVTDANGCEATLPFDITLSEPVELTAPITSTNITCFGSCDGTASVIVMGGVAPYVINWYNAITGTLIGKSGPSATGLCAGEYFAVITDHNGCSFTSDVTIIIEPTKLLTTIVLTDASCFEFCDGTGTITVIGGTPPYTYTWLTITGDPIIGGTTSSVSDLCGGNYTVQVTDAAGCSTGKLPVVIKSFTEIRGTLFSNDATCGIADGNATVFASGGNPGYTYQWFDAAMTPILGATDNIFMDVFSGIYFVTVTDANGCTETFMTTISDLSSTDLVFDEIRHPSCHNGADGSIAVTVTGVNPPLTYIWNPDGLIAEDPTDLSAGIYILEVTDAAGCINYYDTTLINPPAILTTSTIINTECGACNGAITINPTGGTGILTVVWNTGETGSTITGLCSGVYEAAITDANGCLITKTFTVSNSEGLSADGVIEAITCGTACDGSIVVKGIGGEAPYTYEWLHDGSTSPILTGLCAGEYYVQVTDATNCKTTLVYTLLNPNTIEAIATMKNPGCGLTNGSINLMSSGGILPHTYLWNTGDATNSLTGIAAGIYTVTITDASGCSNSFTYALSDVSAAVVELSPSVLNCFGDCNGTIDTLSILGGTPLYDFEWYTSDGSVMGVTTPLITDLCEGKYLLKITDALDCISFGKATITAPDTILVNPLFITEPTCAGVCDGQAISNPFGGTLPFTFKWDDLDGQTTATANDLCAGTYILTITDANGCKIEQTAIIGEPTAITIAIDSLDDATCQTSKDGNIYITISGGTPDYTIEWTSETGETFATEDLENIPSMNYYLRITDANGCTYNDSIYIDRLTTVLASAGSDTLLCNESEITLIGTSNIPTGATFVWYDSDGNVLSENDTLVLLDNANGAIAYILEVTFNGCSDLDTIIITTAPQVYVNAGNDIELYPTQTGVIGGDPTVNSFTTFEWTPIIYMNNSDLENPSIIKPLVSTWYYIVATDTNGCDAIDSVFVKVLPDLTIPDGISPNGDGKNDTWILLFIEQYPGVEMRINVYNRWGEILFVSDQNYNNDWGGTVKEGKRLPAGTYYYVIEVDHEDFPDPFTGPLTIMW